MHVDREYRIIKALADSDVPVPRTHALCTDNNVIGSMFFVMEYLEGRMYPDTKMPGASAPERAGIYDAINDGRRASAPGGLAGNRAGGLRQAGKFFRPPDRRASRASIAPPRWTGSKRWIG